MYLRTATQRTGDNPQDMGGDEGGESSEYESFEEDMEQAIVEEGMQVQSFSHGAVAKQAEEEEDKFFDANDGAPDKDQPESFEE